MFKELPRYPEMGNNDFWDTTVPSHWRVLPGLAVLEENRRKNDGLVESRVLSLSYGRVVVKPVEKQRGLVPDSYEGYQILDPGDIVVRPTDLQNDQTSIRVGLVRDRGIITSAYLGLRARGAWKHTFAYQYLAVVDSSKRIYGMGSGLRQQLGWPDLKRMPCLVPPEEEQAAIVKYLAHANARIDKAITAKRRLMNLLTELLGMATDQLLPIAGEGGPSLSVGQTSHLVQTGPFGSQLHASDYVDNGVPVVNPTNIIDARVVADPSVTVTQGKSEELRRHRFIRGDVVIARRGDLGRSAVVKDAQAGWICGTGSLLIRLDRSYWVPEYFQELFSSEKVRDRLRLSSVGSTMANLNASQVSRMRMWRPPLSEQSEIVRQLRSLRREHHERVSLIAREIDLLREFRSRLVADVVTGQVDVRAIVASLHDAPDPVDTTPSAPDDELDDVMSEGEE